MKDLSGKVAVVTGGASGIGRGLVDRLGGEGMKVAVADIDENALQSTRADLEERGVQCLAEVVDVSVAEEVDRLAARVIEAFGAVHVVCNNAGVVALGQAWEIGAATWQWVIGVNLMGVVNGVRAFVPHLVARGEGHVVNTASMAGLLASPFAAPYTATKHAVVGLTEALFQELAPIGVGVSVLCPGFVRTNLMDAERTWPARLGAVPDGPTDEGGRAVAQFFTEGIAAGSPPAEIADAVIEAVKTGRFWVLTDPDMAALAVERTKGALEGANPGKL